MTNIHVNLPKPHSDIQRKIFKALRTQGLLETWVVCGTKFGKTVSGSVAQSDLALNKVQGLLRWVAPIYPQSLIGLRNISRMLPPSPWVETKQYKITIPSLGTMIEFRSGDKPENLEGEACHGYVLDECAKMRPEVYSSSKTTTTMTRGPILAISTPRGKNWYYKKCMEAKEIMEWEIRNDRPLTKAFFTAPTSANPAIMPSVIEEARRSLPARLFRQYYEAEFVDDGSTFLGFKECFYTELIELFEERQFWFADDVKNCQVVVGADWAKTVDFTVFMAIDIVTGRVVAFERFHKRRYTQAVRQLVLFCGQFGEVLSVYHDKTGVGQAIDDQLSFTKLPYQGITFTNHTKTEMVNSLITSIETKQIGLVQWNVLDSELDAFEVSTNDLGTMTYSAPDGEHDDTVCALMLANAAYEVYADRDLGVKFLEDLKKETEPAKVSKMEEYYKAIANDEDDF